MQKIFLIKGQIVELSFQELVETFYTKFTDHFLSVYCTKELDSNTIKKRCLNALHEVFNEYELELHGESTRLIFKHMEQSLHSTQKNTGCEDKLIILGGKIVQISFDLLLPRFEALCVKFSRKYFFDAYEVEDIKQICYIELFNAYESYDITKGIEFSTIAFKYIKTKLDNIVRNNARVKRSTADLHFIDIYQPLGGSGDGYTYLESIMDESVNVEDEVITSLIIKIIKNNLSEDEILILPVIMGLKTQKQYSEECDISAVAGNKRVKKLEQKLKTLVRVA